MEECTLANRYLEYKLGTAKLVNWLANAARNAQDITAILPSLRRAKAAAKQTKQKDDEQPSSDTMVAIAASQLLSLAEVVMKAKVVVLEDILRTTRGVIAGRQLCAEWYASLSFSTDAFVAERNKKHQHFLGVLRQIQGLLECARNHKHPSKIKKSKIAANSSEPDDSGREEEPLVNMFAGLQVEEPSSNPLGCSTVLKQTAKRVQFELVDSQESKTFTIWCLLQDMRDVRYRVRTRWREYKAERVKLNVAGSVTDYAIGMLRDAESDFVTEHHDLRSYGSIVEHLGLETYQLRTEILLRPAHGKGMKSAREQTLSNADLAHLFCPRASCLLTSFQAAVNARLESDAMSLEAMSDDLVRVHPFGRLLQPLIPDFEALSRVSNRPISSETLTNLHLLADEPRRPIMTSQVIALQIAMDIKDILGQESKREKNQFMAKLVADQQSIRTSLKSIETSIFDNQGAGAVFAAHTLQLHKSMFDDPYHEAHRLSPEDRNKLPKPKPTPFRAYRVFPSVPGLIIHPQCVPKRPALSSATTSTSFSH